MDIDPSQSFSNEIKQYLGLIRRWSWLLVLLAIIGGGISYYYSFLQPKVYEASATVLIDNPQATSDLYYSVYFTDRLTKTYSQMIVQQPTLEGVIEELGLDLSVSKLQGTIQVEAIPDTQLLKISIEDTDPDRAAAIVNSIGIVFASTNAEMQASRYKETKDSLEAQMLSMDQQIEQTSQALELLEPGVEANPQQDILQVQLETYRGIYQEILKQIVDAESETSLDETGAVSTGPAPIEEQMAYVEDKISEISTEIAALGYFRSGPEYEILNTQLNAYKELYQKLVGDFLTPEEGIPVGDAEPGTTTVDTLSAQLEVTAQRILSLTDELNPTGSRDDDNFDRDRLQSNLALYRQTYAGLVQSYEGVRLAEIQNTTRVDLVQPATPPTEPIRPNVTQNAMLGALVGLALGIGTAFLIELINDTVKGPWDIVNRLNLPVLGYIPRMKGSGEYPISASEPRSPIAESFRSLRTNIQYTSVDREIYSLMITSPTPRDGKSVISANLGVVLAQGKHKVGLIDADLRRPQQHKIFDLSNRSGLTDALIKKDINVNGQFKPTRINNLSVLTSGDLPPNPAELVGSEKMVEFIRSLQYDIEILILDTPPVMAVTDPVVLSTRVDGVIVVIRPGVTKLNAAIHTVEQLRQVGANILGVVLNDTESKGARYSNYFEGFYYQYEKYYDYTSEGKTKRKRLPKQETKLQEDQTQEL